MLRSEARRECLKNCLPTDELSPSENERVQWKHFGPARCVPAVKKGLRSRENERRIEEAKIQNGNPG